MITRQYGVAERDKARVKGRLERVKPEKSFEVQTGAEKTLKKPKKVLEKVLTKGSRCDIITKLAARDRRNPQRRKAVDKRRPAKSPKLIEN